MATDRPTGGPDNPDRPQPDPTPPAESHTGPADPAHPGHQAYPVPGEPAASDATPTESIPQHEAGSTAEGPQPTLEFPAPGPAPAYPDYPPVGYSILGESPSSPDASGTAPGPGEHHPTLPLPGGAEGTPRLSGGFHGGPGAFGSSSAAGAIPAEPLEPGSGTTEFTMPVPGLEPGEPPRRGSINVQEAGVTQPRPPTVAEARAREKARKRAEEQEQADADAADAKRRKKKKTLIGGGAIVGVAALVGAGYLAYDAWTGPEVTAMCTVVAKQGEVVPTGPNNQSVTATKDGQEIVVPDNYCSDAQSHGNSGISPGFFLLAGHSYRYYYGGSGTIGHAPSGGSISAPSGATVKTKSGSTIQRGGLGAKVKGGGS